jgi:hypothetical protein
VSQHSFSIANEAGAAFRADVNTALQALASRSSGASAPGTTYAYQPWCDTTNGVLKQRNAANSGWIIRDTLAETRVVSRSSNTILGIGDYGCTFVFTSTFTQTVTAAATLGDDWHCFVRNDGSGVITVDPNSTETIDGGLVLTLNPGDGCRIACNGSAFKTQGLAWKIVKRKTADESYASNAFQDDNDLIFPIGANEEWTAVYELLFSSTNMVAQGAKSAVTVPAGATMLAWGELIWFNTTAVPSQGDTASSGAFVVGGAPTAGATQNGSMRVKLWVLNGATAGNVTLQWAQAIAGGTNLTLKKGAFLTATRHA